MTQTTRLRKANVVPGMDSVKARKKEIGSEQDMALLSQCEILWNNLDEFRRNRSRDIRFAYGDQWGDLIKVDGKTMTEREYTTSVGNVALQANLIKKVINTVAGAWTKEHNEPAAFAIDRAEQQYGDIMTEILKANWKFNRLSITCISFIEEVLLGGLAVARESYERRFGRDDSYTDFCNPNYIFIDSGMQDPCFRDMRIIGQIHDLTFSEFCGAFAETTSDYKKFKEWYDGKESPLRRINQDDINRKHDASDMSFYDPKDPSLCRFFEIWTLERRPRYHVFDPNEGRTWDINCDDAEQIEEINSINNARLAMAKKMGWKEEEVRLIEVHFFMDVYWYYRFMTPKGYIIREGESPLPGRMQPYTICAVPFVNGKIIGYSHDAIDQNRAINRILTLDDWIRRAGVKGVTFIPKKLIPADMDYKTFAKQWTSIDGIIFYEPKPGVPDPKVFYGNPGTVNTAEVVKMMRDIMEDTTAVSGAMQGKTPYAGTSAALYNQQYQNSSTPLATLTEKFNRFTEDIAIKKTKFILENYDTARFEAIAGKLDFDTSMLNLDKMGDIEYDLSIKQSTETPAYRMMENDYLSQLLQAGAITLDDFLAMSMLPFADRLRQRIAAREQEMANQQAAMGGVPQQIGSDYAEKREQIMGPGRRTAA